MNALNSHFYKVGKIFNDDDRWTGRKYLERNKRKLEVENREKGERGKEGWRKAGGKVRKREGRKEGRKEKHSKLLKKTQKIKQNKSWRKHHITFKGSNIKLKVDFSKKKKNPQRKKLEDKIVISSESWKKTPMI